MNRSIVTTTVLVLASAGVLAISARNIPTGSCPLSSAESAATPAAQAGSDRDRQAPTPPAFTAPTLDGRTVSLDEYKGRVPLLDFWATWCGPCIAELPNVKRVYEKHHDEGFDILSVSLDRDRSSLSRFVDREGLDWTHVYNGDARPGEDPASLYGVRAIPTMILIGRDGKVAAANVRGRRLEAEVAKALNAADGASEVGETNEDLDRVIGRTRGPVRNPDLGILDEPAPTWRVDQWFNLPQGAEAIDLADYRGKIVYLYGFQSWCPGCHAHGFPTLQELIKRFDGDDDVAFVAVQTTFEGFGTNTPEKAGQTAERYGPVIPVGHSGSVNTPAPLMRDYRGGGTPWTVIIDRDGVVRFNDFHMTPDEAERLIKHLKSRPTSAATQGEVATLPPERGGQDLIGTRFPDLRFDRWFRHADGATAAPDTKTTLYRWWTDACPFCEASMPAIEQLRREYAEHGLRVVGVYHPKPPRSIPDEHILAAAERLGYSGEVAVDEDWSALRRAYLSDADRSATSVTFLVDAEGTTRFVHPGPQFFPNDEPADAQANEDFDLVEGAIRSLLGLGGSRVTIERRADKNSEPRP